MFSSFPQIMIYCNGHCSIDNLWTSFVVVATMEGVT